MENHRVTRQAYLAIARGPGSYGAAADPDGLTGRGRLLVLPEVRREDRGARTAK